MPVAGAAETNVKTQLFDQMKKSGVLDSLKSQLRGRLYEQLKLQNEKADLSNKIKKLEFKNSLLSSKLDLDYVEILIRKKFLFGKEGETLYIIRNNDN